MFTEITCFDHLLSAYFHARRGNLSKQPTCRFDFYLEQEISKLRWELLNERYFPSAYTYFTVTDPKQRRIAAPSFRDRVVHHALVSRIEPLFERSFITDTYACRVGKGTHYGASRMKKFLMAARSTHGKNVPLYYLQFDICKFFPSISWDVLLPAIHKKITCPRTYSLIERIITTHQMVWVKGEQAAPESEIVSLAERRGLPIGNLTSQLFANFYLSPLDHLVKDQLCERWYCRYMDDVIIISADKNHLKQLKQTLHAFITQELRLSLHANKSFIQNACQGIPFVGYRIFPYHILVRGKTLGRFQKKLKKYRQQIAHETVSPDEALKIMRSFNGHLEYANSWNLQKCLFERDFCQKRYGAPSKYQLKLPF